MFIIVQFLALFFKILLRPINIVLSDILIIFLLVTHYVSPTQNPQFPPVVPTGTPPGILGPMKIKLNWGPPLCYRCYHISRTYIIFETHNNRILHLMICFFFFLHIFWGPVIHGPLELSKLFTPVRHPWVLKTFGWF